jgi:hypothetical protein
VRKLIGVSEVTKKKKLKLTVNLKFYEKIRGINVILSFLMFKF